MRPLMIYTMVIMTILNAIDGDGTTRVTPPLQPITAVPSIGAVKLESARLVTSVDRLELIESDSAIRRVSIGNPEIVEAVVFRGHELVIDAKAAGETTLIVWTAAGRKPFNVVVMPPAGKVDGVSPRA